MDNISSLMLLPDLGADPHRWLAVAGALNAARTPEQVAKVFLESVVPSCGAYGGGVVLVDSDDPRFLRALVIHGYDETVAKSFERFPVDIPMPTRTALREKQAVFVRDKTEWDRLYMPSPVSRTVSAAALPLIVEDECIGAMTLSFDSAQRFEQDARDALLIAASFLAQAVARALAYGREKRERERAEQALQAHERFVTMLSHELRNPLNVILGYAQLANRSDIGREHRENGLRVVERNAAFLSRLVNDLLDVSRLAAQKIVLELTTFDLAAFAADAVATMRPEAERKQLEVTFTGPTDPILIEGDVTRLQQVLVNVLSNAVKFTSTGGAIHVRLQHTSSSVEITVADSGQGINADFLPHVFDAYRQGVTAGDHRQGLGLGLAIAKELVVLHGGNIVAESAGEGHGATFRICLPLPVTALRVPESS